MHIGLWGPAGDSSVLLVQAELSARGATTTSLDPAKFPASLGLTLGADGLLAGDHPLGTVGAWYCRRGSLMSPVPGWVPSFVGWQRDPSGAHGRIREAQEARSVRSSLALLLAERSRLLNPPLVFRRRSLLPALLRLWQRAGLPVVDFVSGNDLERMAYFVSRHDERCWARRMDQQPAQEEWADFAYLKRHHLDLDRHPLLIRQGREGALVRAVVVGGRCLVTLRCEGDGVCAPMDLAPEVGAYAEAAARHTGALLAEVVLELDEAGEAARLVDLDPAPDLAQLEQMSPGTRIGGATAELLLEAAEASGPATPTRGARDAAGTEHEGGGGRPPTPPAIEATPGPDRDLPGPRAARPLIGLAGRVGDSEAAALAAALLERGAEPVPMELPLFPRQRTIHDAAEGAVIGGHEMVGLGAVFLRTTGYSSALPDSEAPALAPEAWAKLYPAVAAMPADQGESFRFKYALLEILGARIPVINPPRGQEVHRVKVWQVLSLARAGLPVPPTLATNDPDAARTFVAAHGGPDQVVAKPLAGIYKTALLVNLDLDAMLARGPVILQRYIQGDTIRTYIVNGRLVGAGRILHSGRSVDSSVEQQGVERVDLPAEVVAQGWAAARHLGLAWTGMDFQRDARTGRCYVLECNASAMFASFSRQTGVDVPGALAELLLRLARPGAPT